MDIDPRKIAYPPSTGVRRIHATPLVTATAASLAGYGRLVDDPKTFPIEIVRWHVRSAATPAGGIMTRGCPRAAQRSARIARQLMIAFHSIR